MLLTVTNGSLQYFSWYFIEINGSPYSKKNFKPLVLKIYILSLNLVFLNFVFLNFLLQGANLSKTQPPARLSPVPTIAGIYRRKLVFYHLVLLLMICIRLPNSLPLDVLICTVIASSPNYFVIFLTSDQRVTITPFYRI